MAGWYPDEGGAQLEREWKQRHPRAVVYKIGDASHSTDPNVSQHAPDWGGSAPGDDRGEVDGFDFMAGNGVTEHDLDDLFAGLVRSRDPRILIVIRRNKIVSSVVHPWVIRTYSGKYHDHVHVSVNDRFDANTSDWHWEAEVPRTVKWVDLAGRAPELQAGDEDRAELAGSYTHVARAQTLANLLDNTTPDITVDGAYGAHTARKIAAVMRARGKQGTAPDGSRLHEPEWRVLFGLPA